jgi:hypothetical protein
MYRNMATMINERNGRRRILMMNIHRYRIEIGFFLTNDDERIVEFIGSNVETGIEIE